MYFVFMLFIALKCLSVIKYYVILTNYVLMLKLFQATDIQS